MEDHELADLFMEQQERLEKMMNCLAEAQGILCLAQERMSKDFKEQKHQPAPQGTNTGEITKYLVGSLIAGFLYAISAHYTEKWLKGGHSK